MTSLDIPTTRALEDLCINTIYANLLTGKLSPHTQTFQITSCTSRDLHLTTTDYPGMISTLTQWSTQCDLVLAEIAGRVRDIKTSATDRKRAEETYEKQLEEARKAATLGKKTKKGKTTEEPETEVMQDVEEQPGPIIRGVNVGGESPSGRKRKLVRPQ
jgi:COP9 signalosome complex subunit 7